MPTYEYRCLTQSCKSLGRTIEVRKSMNEAADKEICPHCVKELQRVLSSHQVSGGDTTIHHRRD